MFKFLRRAAPVTGLALSVAALKGSMNNSYCAAPQSVDYSAVKRDIVTLIEAEEERRNNGTSIAPTFIR